MARRKRVGIVRLRRMLLAVLVVLIGALWGLFLFGRAGLSDHTEESAAEAGARSDESFMVQGEGFDFTLFQEERAVFRIRGDRTRADRRDNVFLERVALTFFREDGDYYLESDEATYNQQTHSARLEGNVLLQGTDELVVTTDWLQLKDNGNVLVASQGTAFRSANRLVGEAETLEIDFVHELFSLGGGVIINSTPEAEVPFSLRANNLIYRKGQRLVRADGEVSIVRGQDHLEARQLSLFLAKESDRVRFVRAVRQVSGGIAAPAEESTLRSLHFEGRSLALLFDSATGDPMRIEIEGGPGRRAVLRSRDRQAVTRSLAAIHISGHFESGVLRTAEAIGPVRLLERTPTGKGPLMRKARSRQAEARFDADGNLGGLTLEDEVTFEDPPYHTTGDRAFLDFEQGSAELFGNLVEVRSPDGRLTAPQVIYWRDRGLLHASQGVRSAFDGSSEVSVVPFEQSEGPVRVESEEAFWRGASQEFLFREQVRAWQGKNILLAQQLRGDARGERISASGGVKTIWHPVEVDEGEGTVGQSEDTEAAEAFSSRAPIEVTAEVMSFLELERKVVYGDGVEVVQEGRTVSCQELQIFLNEKSSAERLDCSGQVRMIDRETNRTISGERAVYRLDAGEVEIFGSPLTVRSPDGFEIQGKRLLYRVEDGSTLVDNPEGDSKPSASAEPQPSG